MQAEYDFASRCEDDKSISQQQPNVDRRASLADSVIGPGALNAEQSFNSKASFEEYLYRAKLTRVNHKDDNPVHDAMLFAPDTQRRRLPNLNALCFWASPNDEKRSGTDHSTPTDSESENGRNTITNDPQPSSPSLERTRTSNGQGPDPRHIPISDEEWTRASRAVRTASWSAVFYLLTMDILGPFSVPWAFAAVG